MLGCGYWVLESAIHAYVFEDGTFRQTFFCENDANEAWMRLLVTFLLAGFGYVSDRVVRAERSQKERALKLSKLLNYIVQLSSQVGETLHADPASPPANPTFRIEKSLLDESEIGKIAHAMQGLSKYVGMRIEGLQALLQLTHEINKGLLVDEVLEKLYESFRTVIPYDRIGVALLEQNGEVLTSRWVRSDYEQTQVSLGYSAQVRGSSLQRIIETGEPRIINDLAEYLDSHPDSKSTSLLVAEGIRSSLTCPLVAAGRPIGVIFFSSRQTKTYENQHSEIFKLIAGQLSVVIEKSHAYEQLFKEKETSDSLLLNVMPARIINRIKAGQINPVEELHNVGILFADIVSFTSIAREYPSEIVAQFLRDVFSRFDDLCEIYGVEKIKTIGDAYMVCSSIPDIKTPVICNLAEFAQALVGAANQLSYPDGRPLEIRIGMHAGPVVAGVIGQKKFAYDVWGDTVNLAQRLESTGQPGRVHVSESICRLLSGSFDFEPRGEIELKGQGKIFTYYMKPKPIRGQILDSLKEQ
ncbi:MAG: GAF domain-containing protein [Candidatus Hydrogenedentes bacterium]|nr:GAF domain-containing protein [Candidatus Hydrogenedentota bacterium]